MFTSVTNPAYQAVPLAGKVGIGTYTQAVILGTIVTAAIGPFVGLITSAYFVRYKVMRAAIWLVWIANPATKPLLIFAQFFPQNQHMLYYAGVLTAKIAYFVGLSLFMVNSVPFALDQMPDASGDQIGALIHWYAW